jgi:hypothetical protein
MGTAKRTNCFSSEHNLLNVIDQELRRNLFRVGIIVVAFFGAIFVSVFLNSYALSGLFWLC